MRHQLLVGRQSLLRALNYRAVFERLAHHGPQSRTEIAHRLELSQASVSRLADGLLGARLIVEGPRVASRAGRRQTLLDINPKAAVVAGVSVRSRSTRVLLADLKGDPVAQRRFVREDESAHALAAQIHRCITDLRTDLLAGLWAGEAPTPLGAIVVGISGAVDPNTHRVHAAPNLSVLDGVDVGTLLLAELDGDAIGNTVTVDNDVNFAALGEGAYGAARGVDNFFYLNLGSGVGGAAVVHGRLHRGALGFAGEVGYLPICTEGSYTSLEALVGRRAIEDYTRRSGLGESEADFFGSLEREHPLALEIAERISGYLALAVAAIVTTLNPKLIVLGGSVGRHGDYWIASIRARVAALLPVVPQLVSTDLGRDASLRGAVAHGVEMARHALVTEEL